MGARRGVDAPWQMVAADLMGPFPRSMRGFKYLLVMTDTFSKFTILKPLRSAPSNVVAKHLKEDVFMLFGVPRYFICDNGPEFIGQPMKTLMTDYKVKVLFNTSRHPQANPTEGKQDHRNHAQILCRRQSPKLGFEDCSSRICALNSDSRSYRILACLSKLRKGAVCCWRRNWPSSPRRLAFSGRCQPVQWEAKVFNNSTKKFQEDWRSPTNEELNGTTSGEDHWNSRFKIWFERETLPSPTLEHSSLPSYLQNL